MAKAELQVANKQELRQQRCDHKPKDVVSGTSTKVFCVICAGFLKHVAS